MAARSIKLLSKYEEESETFKDDLGFVTSGGGVEKYLNFHIYRFLEINIKFKFYT